MVFAADMQPEELFTEVRSGPPWPVSLPGPWFALTCPLVCTRFLPPFPAIGPHPSCGHSQDTPARLRQAVPHFIAQSTTREAWAFKQTMVAASTFLLAATAHGVQTCPMEGFESVEAVALSVGIDPKRYSVPVVVSVGYELAPPKAPSPRFPPAQQWFTDHGPSAEE